MDMFLEQYGPKEQTGTMRGMFLTMWNLPTIITPFIAGLIIGTADTQVGRLAAVQTSSNNLLSQLHDIGYWKIYLISAAFLIPFMIILKTNFGGKKDPVYPDMHIMDTLRHFIKHKNVFDVFIDRLLLNLFFAWNAIFLPIFLHQFIGFTWNEVGILLIMTSIPFVMFQGQIGRMQDRRAQEKSLLIAGFMIMAAGSILMSFISSANMLSWVIILFITHLGASFVEVSSDSYFFKHVSPTNSGFISLFRMTRTIPYLVMPPFIALILVFLPFSYMFLVLGLAMLVGMRYALLIK